MQTLSVIDDNIWSVSHHFKVNGAMASSRMTVIRLQDNQMVLHSPVPVTAGLKREISRLGEVKLIIAPNKMHHLFLAAAMQDFPAARAFGTPGLTQKRPDIGGLETLSPEVRTLCGPELDFLLFEGLPVANETIWFHKPSRSLIVTDLLQWFRGDMDLSLRIWARLMGVRHGLAVPRHVRWLIKDKTAARSSAAKVMAWPFERVIVAHNVIVESNAHELTQQALSGI